MEEQKIVIGLITSTEYVKQIAAEFDLKLIDSGAAKLLAKWSLEHFQKYKVAPAELIEDIYMERVQAGSITEEIAEEIQEDIFPMLSKKYEAAPEKTKYLLDLTRKYFSEQRLVILTEHVDTLLEKGEVAEAENAVREHKEITTDDETLDFSSPELEGRITQAFKVNNNMVLQYPGALGDFWNEQMVRGGLIGLMAPEKRGKTFMLLDMAMRAVRQGQKVAFFQAGDMTEAQQVRRMAIYLAKRSDKEKYCGDIYVPVKDCIRNQLDTCDKSVRECAEGLMDPTEKGDLLTLKKSELIELHTERTEYTNCYNCTEWERSSLGMPWFKKVEVKSPLREQEAQKRIKAYFKGRKRQLKMSTHANGTLSVDKMNAILDGWKFSEGFEPSLIIIDYGDLVIGEGGDERTKQNNVWKGFRGMSQDRDALLIVPTQTDAMSYEADTLSLKNFSEDKRKFAHVTAMYGLNHDVNGREKGIGLLRINEILLREGDYDTHRQVTVLQQLAIGRPILGSYWAANEKSKE